MSTRGKRGKKVCIWGSVDMNISRDYPDLCMGLTPRRIRALPLSLLSILVPAVKLVECRFELRESEVDEKLCFII